MSQSSRFLRAILRLRPGRSLRARYGEIVRPTIPISEARLLSATTDTVIKTSHSSKSRTSCYYYHSTASVSAEVEPDPRHDTTTYERVRVTELLQDHGFTDEDIEAAFDRCPELANAEPGLITGTYSIL